MSYRGGTIVHPNSEDQFNEYVINSTCIPIGSGLNGTTYLLEVKNVNRITHPYFSINTGTSLKTPVRKLIIKNVFLYPERMSMPEDTFDSRLKNFGIKTIPVKIDEFVDEINIQIDIYFKTLDYLQPICPAVIYSHIIPISEIDNFPVVRKMFQGADYQLLSEMKKNPTFEFLNLGIIAMEFAEGYDTEYNLHHNIPFQVHGPKLCPSKKVYVATYDQCYAPCKPTQFRNNLTRRCKKKPPVSIDRTAIYLYYIIELALKTGYCHVDLHMGNIMINNNYENYFYGINGRVLIIDFGASNIEKLNPTILKNIKNQWKAGNYVSAAKILCKFTKRIIDNKNFTIKNVWNKIYNWLCKSTTGAKNEQLNETLRDLYVRREKAIDHIVRVADRLHNKNPDKYPILPVSNNIKNKLYNGIIA